MYFYLISAFEKSFRIWPEDLPPQPKPKSKSLKETLFSFL